MRAKPTHAYIAREPGCGCVTMMTEDAPEIRWSVANDVAEAICDGRTIERVPIEQARLTLECPRGLKHAGSALVEPPTPRGDEKRLYHYSANMEAFVLAASRGDAERIATSKICWDLDDRVHFDDDPRVRAIVREADIPTGCREMLPLVADDDDAPAIEEQTCGAIVEEFEGVVECAREDSNLRPAV